MINVAIITNSIGGVKTPPYSTIGKGDVGSDACIAPQAGARPSGPMTSIGPYSKDVEEFRPKGVNLEKDTKALRKMQSFLHFLAFGFFDHNFGVLRGEQPLRRGSLPRNSETFFATFFGHKKGRPNGCHPL